MRQSKSFHRWEIAVRMRRSRRFDEGPSNRVRLNRERQGQARRAGTTLSGGLPLFRLEGSPESSREPRRRLLCSAGVAHNGRSDPELSRAVTGGASQRFCGHGVCRQRHGRCVHGTYGPMWWKACARRCGCHLAPASSGPFICTQPSPTNETLCPRATGPQTRKLSGQKWSFLRPRSPCGGEVEANVDESLHRPHGDTAVAQSLCKGDRCGIWTGASRRRRMSLLGR